MSGIGTGADVALFPQNTSTVNTVAELQAFNGSSSIVIVKDSLRGGVFTYVAEGLTADNGIVFNATGKGSGYWFRQLSNIVMPEWYGAIANGVTNDSTAIQAATVYAENNKKTLVLSAGTYTFGSEVNITSSVDIIGSGFAYIKNNTGVKLFIVNADNVTISGLKTKTDTYVDDIGQIYITGKNCKVQGCYFEGQSWTAVDIDSTATDFIFKDNQVKDFEFGIYCRATTGVRVLNNTFTGGFDKPSESLGIVGDGIKLSSPVDLVSPGNDMTVITGNRFINMVRDGIDFFTGAQNIIVSNNLFEKIGVLPLDIKTIYRDTASSGTSVPDIRQDKKILITGNIFKDSGYENEVSGYPWVSIVGRDETSGQTHDLLDSPLDISITNNQFENSSIYGFIFDNISRVTVTDNIIKAPQENTSHHCFWLESKCDNIDIKNNLIYDVNSAVLRSPVFTHTNIAFNNNIVRGKEGNTQTMFYIGGSFIDISNNEFDGGNNIIYSPSIVKSVIDNNIFRNATGNVIDIRSSASRVSVNNNKIYDSAYGIRFASTMTNCTVTNNSCFNVANPYLSISSIGANSVVHNNASDTSDVIDVLNEININSKKITNLANGTAAGDAINKSQLDAITFPTILNASATLDFPSTAVGAKSDLLVSVPGAEMSDIVTLGIPHAAVQNAGEFIAWVDKPDSVTIRFTHNDPVNPIDPPSGLFKIKIFKD